MYIVYDRESRVRNKAYLIFVVSSSKESLGKSVKLTKCRDNPSSLGSVTEEGGIINDPVPLNHMQHL